MISATQIRKGMVILHQGDPHRVLEFHHRTPGKGRGFVQLRLRNLRTGSSLESRLSSGDTVERAFLEQQEMEFLYQDGDSYYFMNTENFEQVALNEQNLGDYRSYLKGGERIKVEFFEKSPIGLEMPSYVELKVMETEPALKGATASSSSKPATLETGLVVQVPSFIREGEMIRINPTDGRYLERAK